MTGLQGVRVLITRPRGSGHTLRDGLERLGATVVEAPATEIRPVVGNPALDDALAHLDRYDWVAFTSGNAVAHFLAALANRRAAMPAQLRIAAVGPATIERLRDAGLPVECSPGEATATDLAHAMIRLGVRGMRALLPAGDRARPDLARALRAAGAQVEQVIVYHTAVAEGEGRERLRAALNEGTIAVAALASPSAFDGIVTALDGNLQPLRRVRLVCIGPTTAAAVRSAGLTVAAVAEPHTTAGLVAAIAGLFAG